MNRPLHPNNPFQRDGYMAVNGNSGSKPNYPSTFEPIARPTQYSPTNEQWGGQAVNFQFQETDEDYVQANGLWQVLGRTPGQQENLIYNVSSHLKDAEENIRRRSYGMFSKVDQELGRRIEAATEQTVRAV